jgi:hypothetical protein
MFCGLICHPPTAYAGSRKPQPLLPLLRSMVGLSNSQSDLYGYMTVQERIDFTIIIIVFGVLAGGQVLTIYVSWHKDFNLYCCNSAYTFGLLTAELLVCLIPDITSVAELVLFSDTSGLLRLHFGSFGCYAPPLWTSGSNSNSPALRPCFYTPSRYNFQSSCRNGLRRLVKFDMGCEIG